MEQHTIYHQWILRTLLVTGALLTMTGVAVAGGNTIAASAKTSTLSASASRTLASGLSDGVDKGTDVCATIINRSDKTGLIGLTLTDVLAGTTTSQIAKAKSSGLCGEDMESVAVTCLGPSKCAFTWSIDKF
jgi:hypothetical protein